jgi:hypothetical protein
MPQLNMHHQTQLTLTDGEFAILSGAAILGLYLAHGRVEEAVEITGSLRTTLTLFPESVTSLKQKMILSGQGISEQRQE